MLKDRNGKVVSVGAKVVVVKNGKLHTGVVKFTKYTLWTGLNRKSNGCICVILDKPINWDRIWKCHFKDDAFNLLVLEEAANG